MSELLEPRLVGRVKEIHRFPVKSMVGERLTRTTLRPSGVPKDRVWALRDLDLREITSAKRLPKLLQCSARFVNEGSDHVEITLPSGLHITSEQADASEVLSDALKRNLRLEPLQPATNRKHYRTGKFRGPGALRQLLGVRKGGPLPDMSDLPVAMLATLALHATPPGVYFDVFPIHLVTTASLATLSAAVGEDARVERFRPNVVIETEASETGYPELAWKGELLVGDAALRLRCPTFRCGMPSHAQANDVPKSPAIVRTIYDELGTKFGSYASVARDGAIAVGDPVYLAAPRPRRVDAWARIVHPLKRRVLHAYVGFGRN